jgi:hypothetical protein
MFRLQSEIYQKSALKRKMQSFSVASYALQEVKDIKRLYFIKGEELQESIKDFPIKKMSVLYQYITLQF